VKRNALALAARLRDFGATVCQVDDGWQGVGHGLGENRDWTTIDRRFPAGMADLAAFIRAQGLEPGIWIAPHGQSNEAVVRESGAFLLKPDGTTASSTWTPRGPLPEPAR
jgi:alpha-galactosidase